jgi:hypothetical protein
MLFGDSRYFTPYSNTCPRLHPRPDLSRALCERSSLPSKPQSRGFRLSSLDFTGQDVACSHQPLFCTTSCEVEAPEVAVNCGLQQSLQLTDRMLSMPFKEQQQDTSYHPYIYSLENHQSMRQLATRAAYSLPFRMRTRKRPMPGQICAALSSHSLNLVPIVTGKSCTLHGSLFAC